MATNWITVKAKLKWAKVYEPDSFAGATNWKVNVYPVNDEEWAKIEKSGLALGRKEDIDGTFITVRRPTKKAIGDNLVIFSPPAITGQVKVAYQDEDGNPVRQYNKGEFSGKIVEVGKKDKLGNGTLAYVNLCVYDTAKGKGHRLEGLNILELVEYGDGPVVKDEEDEKGEAPGKEVPKAEEKKPKKEDKKTTEEDLNDDIPW